MAPDGERTDPRVVASRLDGRCCAPESLRAVAATWRRAS
jgi:hypothetical protein